MANSKDPARYGPDFQNVVMEMERGTSRFRARFADKKSATNFRMRLYSYAEALKREGNILALAKDARSEAYLSKYRAMTRYRLYQEEQDVICVHQEKTEMAQLIVEDSEVISAEAAKPEILADDAIAKIQEDTVSRLFPVRGPTKTGE